MALAGAELRAWLHDQLDIACARIRDARERHDEVEALVYRGEMHAIVRMLREVVDGEDMVAIFDLVAVTIGDAEFDIRELHAPDRQDTDADSGSESEAG